MRSFLARVLTVAALVLGSVVALPPASQAAAPAPTELAYACALKSNGQMRVVTSTAQCGKNETRLTIKPGPVLVCVQPSGSARYVTSFKDCKPPALQLTLPPASGTVYFCADNATRVLRYVTDPSQCTATETPYVVTPNDAAPTVLSIVPADGATHVSSTPSFTVTFSEPVGFSGAAFTFQCNGTSWPGGVGVGPGSTTFTVSFAPAPALQGATCVFTVVGSKVYDLDTIDPPDTMVGTATSTVTIDTAPSVSSVVPANNAVDVAVGSDVVLTFSEPITYDSGAFTLTCAASPVPVKVTGGNSSTITLNPDDPMPSSATCGLTVTALKIHDVDAGDPPDTMVADFTAGFTTADEAPRVVSTTPADGATDVSPSVAPTVTFSEPVDAASGAFTLSCGGTDVALTASAGPAITFTLTPAAALPKAAACTLTVVAAEISDSDTIDPPDQPDTNYTSGFTTASNSAPTDIDLSPKAVAENEPTGTTVGSLTTTDADPGDTFTYTLVAGSGDTDNALFQVSGSALQTAAVLDAEQAATRSVRVRSTDSGGASTEKSFTISVTDVNEAPGAPTLSPSDVDENEPVGTTVGTISATDPDAGQTVSFSVVTTGCGGTYADGSAFTASGTSLKTAAVLNYEVKDSYQVCLRATDSGSPALATDNLVTVTVNDVNDPPSTLPDSYTGAVGNTMFALNLPATPGPRVAVTGSVLTANDSDEDAGDSISAVAETVTSTGGGTATIDADGNFTFLPGVGDKGQDDTFTYHVTDSHGATAPGTVTVSIGATLVWWVDNSSAAATHDGRSTSPLTSLTTLNGAGGAGDSDATGDTIFVYTGNATYTGGLRLEANQSLLGERAGVGVGPMYLVQPGTTSPVLTNAAGNGVDLADGTAVSGIDIADVSGDGVNGVGVSTASVGSGVPMTISGSAADGVDLSGAGSGAITLGATITSSGSRSLAVSGRTGSTVAVSGAITGKGVELSSNTGATVNLTGALSLTTTTTPAFSATGGGTVSSSNVASTATSTTGGGVIVENTTIGSAGLKFRSVSANGAVNGIRLTSTGSSGSLAVSGAGSTAQGGDASGGTIQATSGPGILLTSTLAPSFNNVSVLNVPTASGVKGTGVTGFAFTNGRISGSGLSGSDTANANIAFNGVSTGVTNLSGAVTIGNSVLENAYGGGIDVYNEAGTISSINVTGNLVRSTTSATTSKGYGITVQAVGSAASAASVAAGSVSTNSVLNFPSGGGVQLIGGNVTGSGAPSSTLGSAAGSRITLSGNTIRGESVANPMATQCVLVSVAGKGSGYVDVTNNGSAGTPLGNNKGNCISVNATGAATLTSTVTGNYVSPAAQSPLVASGIAGGSDKQVLGDASTLDSAVLSTTVSNNTVSSTTGVGIRYLANSSGTLSAKVQNNTVGASSVSDGVGGTVGNYAIRVDSGTSTGTAVDTNVCLQVSGNTATGSTSTATASTFPGIGLRKQGTVATTNDFGIVGLANNPATAAQAESYVSSQNPGSTSGTFGTGGAAVVSGSNFIPCTLAF